MFYMFPQFPRSIFRHVVEGTDTLYHNRFADLESDFSARGWDFLSLDLGDFVSDFFFTVVPTGDPDQRWWEGTRVLLASVSLRVQDTMTICIDTTFWPPINQLAFARWDGELYFPRHNMPFCFKVDTAVGNAVHEITGSPDSRPSEFSLSQNYPNPFNPITNIRFSVFKTANVKIEVFNIVGQKVRTLINEEMASGVYMVDWDGKDENSKAVSSGIYFYRMQAGDEFTDMKKMLLVK